MWYDLCSMFIYLHILIHIKIFSVDFTAGLSIQIQAVSHWLPTAAALVQTRV
jgi:hypothetical protein